MVLFADFDFLKRTDGFHEISDRYKARFLDFILF
jgi:hypothetical protein